MIQITDTHSFAQRDAARLGPNHGYRINGDMALLHADVAVSSAERAQWALQLWACDRPFSGGRLEGVKVAEAAVPLEDASVAQRLDAEALARVPGGQRDYSMVLVLASGSNGAFDQIHDFANYPARERFITPHLEGSVGYQVDGSEVTLRAESVRNPRDLDNLSGSLVLELWATREGYHGGPIENGALLASAELGRLAGQGAMSFERRAHFSAPAAGDWNVALMLREWAPGGYVTRDFCTFAETYTVAERVEAVRNELPKIEAAVVEEQPKIETSATEEQPKIEAAAAEEHPVPESEAAAAEEQPAPEIEAAPAEEQPAPKIEAPAQPAQKKLVTAPPAATAAPANTNAEQPANDGRVSVMTASIEEIAQLKGLTRKVAIEVVKGRPYANIDELTRVRGIGPKMLAKLRPYVKL